MGVNSSNLVELTAEEVSKYLPFIVERGIPLRRKKKSGEFSYIPTAEFDRYLGSREMVFYVDKPSFDSMMMSFVRESTAVTSADAAAAGESYSEIDEVFAGRLKESGEMDRTERLQALMNNIFKVREFLEDDAPMNGKTMGALGDIFGQTICINKASFEENLVSPAEGDHLDKLVNSTMSLIDGFIDLVHKGKASFRDLARLGYIQTGSVSLNHMNRILVRFVSFMFYYNSYFQKNSMEVQRFRTNFNRSFLPYYSRVVKESQKINLEIIFKGGFSPVSSRSTFVEYCLGGFFHDIGKFPEIEYHDSGQAYDVKKASRHVFDGYNMLLQSKEVPYGVVAVGLLHHDYYGAPYGYRQVETLRKKFSRNKNMEFEKYSSLYFISKDVMDVAKGNSLSYFPAKVMEILDVYDAMTDSEKKYRSGALSPGDALYAMRNDFINTERLGLDPILFNIFVDFLFTSAVITPDVVKEVKVGV